jgi:hypothetical protein
MPNRIAFQSLPGVLVSYIGKVLYLNSTLPGEYSATLTLCSDFVDKRENERAALGFVIEHFAERFL